MKGVFFAEEKYTKFLKVLIQAIILAKPIRTSINQLHIPKEFRDT